MSSPGTTHVRTRRRSTRLVPLVAVTLVSLLGLAGCGAEEKGAHLALSAAVPDQVPDGTVLRVGDPATQTALELSGLADELDIEIEWANISGGDGQHEQRGAAPGALVGGSWG